MKQQVEQELATPSAGLSAASMFDAVAALLRGTGGKPLADKDAARLVCLYALRFQGEEQR